MSRVIRRSFARAFDHAELWPGTGNRETFARWLRKDHPIRWAWDRMAMIRERYKTLFAEAEWPHLQRRRFKSPAEAEAWLSILDHTTNKD